MFRAPPLASAPFVLALAALGCDPGTPTSDLADAAPPAQPDAAPQPPARTGVLGVVYRSSLEPGPWVAMFAELNDNDLFKFADNTARVSMTPPPGERVVGLTVEVGGRLLFDEAIEGRRDATARVSVPLGTAAWTEGIHPVRYVATTDTGTEVVGEEEIRVYFDVTGIAADPDDPHLLWLGTLETGLLAYHLGDDPLDPADDRALPYGGHLLDLADITPPGGRPWLGSRGVAYQHEPAGQVVLAVAHAQGGVFVGAAWRGVSYLDDRGTPFERVGDRYALFHPGTQLAPETFEAGLANTVTAIVADGERGLWLGTLHGLFHVDHRGTLFDAGDDIWTVFDSAGAYDPNISRLALDDAGRIWIASFDTDGGHSGNTVTMLDPGGTPSDVGDDAWVRLALPEGFPAEATGLAVDGDRVFMGTSEGLYLLDHGGTPLDPADDRWRHASTAEGLIDDDIGAIAPRPDGRIWVGAYDICAGDGGGLMLIDADACLADGACAPEVRYTVDDGLLDDDVSSLHILPDGSVALGTFNLLAAPLLSAIFSRADAEDCRADAEDGPERNVGPMVGRDGLSIIDPGADLEAKADDGLVNL